MLSALHHTLSKVMQGDVDAGRMALELLPEWLQFHIATTDKDLADAVRRKAHIDAAG
jgi:hemerythrin